MVVQTADSEESAPTNDTDVLFVLLILFDQQIYEKLRFPPEVQRCIVGKRMRHNKETLASCGLTYDGCVVFVYILSAETVGLNNTMADEEAQDNEISVQGNRFLSVIWLSCEH